MIHDDCRVPFLNFGDMRHCPSLARLHFLKLLDKDVVVGLKFHFNFAPYLHKEFYISQHPKKVFVLYTMKSHIFFLKRRYILMKI